MRIFRAAARVILTALACRRRRVGADTHWEFHSAVMREGPGASGPSGPESGSSLLVLVVSGERHARVTDCTAC